MRKFFYGLGITFAVLLVAAAIGMFVLIRNGSALDSESKAYADDAIVSITRGWSKDELVKRASPEFMQVAAKADLDAFLDAARTALGPLVDYHGSKGQSFMFADMAKGATITGDYSADAQYQKGTATVRLHIRKIGDKWMIDSFNVDSAELMRQLTGRGT